MVWKAFAHSPGPSWSIDWRCRLRLSFRKGGVVPIRSSTTSEIASPTAEPTATATSIPVTLLKLLIVVELVLGSCKIALSSL